MGLHKTKQPMFPKEFIWPAKMIHIATDTLRPLAAFPQNAAQATSNPPIKRRKRPLMAMFEILKPSLKHTIYVRRDSRKTFAVAASGLGTNGIFELPQTLLAGPTCASLKAVSKEVKSLTRKGGIYHAGLLWMQDQPPFHNQLLHLVQGFRCLRLITTHDDKVIGIADHLKTRYLHHLINGMEVEIGQQGTDNGALGCSCFGRPPGQPLHDVLTEKSFDQLKQAAIGNIPADFLPKFLMGNAVKVRLQIGIHYMGVAGFQEPIHFPQGILASSVGPETVTVRFELRLEYRLYNQPYRRLDYPIPHGGDTQGPLLFTAKLVYIDPLDRSRSVGPGAKLCFQPDNIFLKSLLKPLHAFMIRPGTASVPSDRLPGGVKGCWPVHLIDQAEPNFSFHPLFEGLQHALRPYGTFHPVIRPGFSLLFSRLRHCHGYCFVLYRHRSPISLRPFAPRPLHRFFANMDALTPDRRALRTLSRGNELPACPRQVSLVHTARPSMHSVTNHPVCSDVAFLLSLQRVKHPCTFYSVHGSGFALYEEAHRTSWPNRVRYPTDCMFASGCSPPRFTVTQLPSATEIGHNLGGGLSPPKSRLLPGALIPAKAGIQEYQLVKILDPAFAGV